MAAARIAFGYKRFYFMVFNRYDSYPNRLGADLTQQLRKAQEYDRYFLYRWRMVWSYMQWKAYTDGRSSKELPELTEKMSFVAAKPFPYFIGCDDYPSSFIWNIEEQLAVMPSIIQYQFGGKRHEMYPTTLHPECSDIGQITKTLKYPDFVDHDEYMKTMNNHYTIKAYTQSDDLKQELNDEIKYIYCIDLWQHYFHVFSQKKISFSANLHDRKWMKQYENKFT